MATFDLGRVTPIYKGDYSASASYELNDVVLYNGNLYWHVKATATVGILPTDTTVWKLAFADGGVRTEIRGYADDAQASVEAASASATSASTSATSAQSSATSASQSATQASTSATNASASASQAQEYAEQAEESAAALSDINERLRKQQEANDYNLGNVYIELTNGYYIPTNQEIGAVVDVTRKINDTNYYNAIADCVEGDTFYITGHGDSLPRLWAFVDASNIMLLNSAAGVTNAEITAPANAAKIIINTNRAESHVLKGAPEVKKQIDSMRESIGIIEEKVDEFDGVAKDVETLESAFYINVPEITFIEGEYINTHGSISTISLTAFKHTDLIPLDPNASVIRIPATNIKSNPSTLMVAYYSGGNTISTGTFISGISPSGQPIESTIPKNAKYVAFGSNTSGTGAYAELDADITIFGAKKMATDEDGSGVTFKCADQYNLIVGDTFELFYKGIINSFDSDSFFVSASCPIGASYTKKYMVTPTTAGTYQLALTLYDNKGKQLDQKVISLVVNSAPSAPASEKVVLCVGDSLTQNGLWPTEMKRRLTGTGGTPSGFNLSNIAFIGNCEANGTKYEGYGGFTFEKYNTNYAAADSKVITCTHDKQSEEDQHSIYMDGAGNTWKLETIFADSIKTILNSGNATTIPSSGTLTWVSGGTNHANITYTNVVNGSGNPFWNSSASKVDFASYATAQGKSTINYVYVLLGWNDWGRDMSYIKGQAQTFISNVHSAFPNAKVVLMGLEIPSRDGLAAKYGTYTGVLSDYMKMLQFVHDIDDMYDELVGENTNVYHINISGQFDTEHNMPKSTRVVNVRNSETEVYQTNGIHPASSGTLQIADAATRHMVSIL